VRVGLDWIGVRVRWAGGGAGLCADVMMGMVMRSRMDG